MGQRSSIYSMKIYIKVCRNRLTAYLKHNVGALAGLEEITEVLVQLRWGHSDKLWSSGLFGADVLDATISHLIVKESSLRYSDFSKSSLLMNFG